MTLEQIAQHLKIAELAIAHQKAKMATVAAKQEYHLAWNRYETGDENYGRGDNWYYVHQEERICRNHPDFEHACEATKFAHDFYREKKRIEYNAKRRLETAIRRLA